jgi:hypothetical protein
MVSGSLLLQDPFMATLDLRPLPVPTDSGDPPTGGVELRSQAFVDDLVVMRLVAGEPSSPPPAQQTFVVPGTEDDFAGWHPPGSPPRAALVSSGRVPGREVRVAPSPDEAEPGIGHGSPSGRGWWLAGLAGAFSALVFSVLLLSLSARDIRPDADPASALRGWPPVEQSPAPAPAAETTPVTGPELTRIPPVD